MVYRYYEEKLTFCFICRKMTMFHHKDSHNNIGVESHCGECEKVWFEWQNRAVERELVKWVEYNNTNFTKNSI